MDSKIIIFDGPDNVGKTTQIKLLMQNLICNPTYINYFPHINGITQQESNNYNIILYNDMFTLMNKAFDKNRNLIFDRSYISEFVYGKLYRNQNTEYIFHIEANGLHYLKNKLSIFLIIFIDNYKNLINREDGNSFSINEKDKINEIKLFKKAYKKSNIKNKILINVDNKSKEEVNINVLNFLGLNDIKKNI